MKIEHISPESLLNVPGYGQVVIAPAGRLAFIAGQTAYDREFNLLGADDFHAQTLATFRNLTIALAAAGAAPSDVVSSTVYIAGLDMETAQAFTAAMNVALDGHPFPPNALTLIGVGSFVDPRQLIEISAVAAIPERP